MTAIERFGNTDTGTGTGDGSPGDPYATLSEWEADEQTNLVTDTDTHLVNFVGVAADTSRLLLDGWTTNSSFFITINGNNTTGKFSDSHYRIVNTPDASSQATIRSTVPHTVFNDVQVHVLYDGTFVGSRGYGLATSATNTKFNRCIAKGNGLSTGGGQAFNIRANDSVVTNCLAYDFQNTDMVAFTSTAASGTVDLLNCIAYECFVGFDTQSSTNLKNCLGQKCNDNFLGSISSADFCASDTGDAPGTNAIDTISTMTFADVSGGDFRPKIGETADDLVIRVGLDLSGVFTDDLAGDTRVAGPYTLGALIAAPPAGVLRAAIHAATHEATHAATR